MGAVDYSKYERLIVTKTDGIAEVCLNNPAKLNAIDTVMHANLEYVWDDLNADEDVRAVVVTGSGRAFCSGIDIKEQVEKGRSGRGPRPRSSRRLFWNLLDFEKPLIAKVRGAAFGLGASVALLSDVVVAEDQAIFCDSHATLGITPGDGGAALWPLLIGFSRAKELLMLGEQISSAQALELGLINHRVESAKLDGFVKNLANRFASAPPLALWTTKIAVNSMLKQLVAGAFETSLAYDLLTLRTEDHAAAAAAFKDKHKGPFNAR